jgi:hypothetical protein
MLKALADGETDPAALAVLGDQRLRATPGWRPDGSKTPSQHISGPAGSDKERIQLRKGPCARRP